MTSTTEAIEALPPPPQQQPGDTETDAQQQERLERPLREYCGVFGMVDPKTRNLGHLLYYGLYALQHRGQESCGMAVFDNDQLRIHKDMGLVNQVFSPPILEKMTGQIGMGHTRYSTTGGSTLDNAQPVVVRSRVGAITLAHNGNLIQTEALEADLKQDGMMSYGDSDSHLMANHIRYGLQMQERGASEFPLADAVKATLEKCQGAFSLIVATGDTLIAARDPHGFRPLCLGHTPDGALVVASETCALDIVGAVYDRDIDPGEVFVARLDGTVASFRLSEPQKKTLLLF